MVVPFLYWTTKSCSRRAVWSWLSVFVWRCPSFSKGLWSVKRMNCLPLKYSLKTSIPQTANLWTFELLYYTPHSAAATRWQAATRRVNTAIMVNLNTHVLTAEPSRTSPVKKVNSSKLQCIVMISFWTKSVICIPTKLGRKSSVIWKKSDWCKS